MSDPIIEARKKLTFEQAEGAEPLPSQLKPKELTRELRARLWELVLGNIEGDVNSFTYEIGGRWAGILQRVHVNHYGRMIDNFDTDLRRQKMTLRPIFEKGDYLKVFGFIQAVLRDRRCPENFSNRINQILTDCRSAYRVFDGDTIAPIASEEERKTLIDAFSDLGDGEFKGARTHLRQAVLALSEGRYADSARDSIHAVEAVARILAPTEKLSDALTNLEVKAKMHPAMKKGFVALYGWTSDEQGIRHPLLNEGDANVDESDALFMIGACASFISYLIAKGRKAGLIAG